MKVEVPDCVIDVGFRFAVILALVPTGVRLTVPTKPFMPVMVMVNVVDEPRSML